MRKVVISTLMLLMFAGSAFAMIFEVGENKIDLYASIRNVAYYNGASGSEMAGFRDRDEFRMGMAGNSRFGALWTYQNFAAHFEIGTNGSDAGNNTGLGLRLLYGTYRINGGDYGIFRAGQMASISHTQQFYQRRLNSDNAFAGAGTLNDTRRPGFYYRYDNFEVALRTLSQDTGVYTSALAAIDDAGATPVFLQKFPKISLAYTFPADNILFRVSGAFAMYNAEIVLNGSHKQVDATAYHIALAVVPRVDKFVFELTGFYSQNGGMYGMVLTGNGAGSTISQPVGAKANGSIENVQIYGGALGITYLYDPAMFFSGGVGYQVATSDAYAADDNNMQAYINANFRVERRLLISPEISYDDYMDNLADYKDAKVVKAGVYVRFDI